MPRQKVVHFNPLGPTFQGITRCGRELRKSNWTSDKDDVTCNNCVRFLKRERAVERDQRFQRE